MGTISWFSIAMIEVMDMIISKKTNHRHKRNILFFKVGIRLNSRENTNKMDIKTNETNSGAIFHCTQSPPPRKEYTFTLIYHYFITFVNGNWRKLGYRHAVYYLYIKHPVNHHCRFCSVGIIKRFEF